MLAVSPTNLAAGNDTDHIEVLVCYRNACFASIFSDAVRNFQSQKSYLFVSTPGKYHEQLQQINENVVQA